MKQPVLKNAESRDRVSKGPISLIVALILLNGVLFPNSCSVMTLVAQTTAQEAKPTDVRELKQGAPIERELKGGEAHSYRVMLTAGQYLKVVVEQKGIDVVVRLLGPDGKQITEVDSPNGTQGPEPVSVIAEATGEYRLEVKALEKAAAAGRYGVRVEDLREATAEDRDRLAAERAVAEARQLRAQGTAESRRKAIEKYTEALPFLRAVGDRQGEASTLDNTGNVYWQLGESRKALEYYGQALSLWRAVGNRRGEANTLSNIGNAYWRLGENQKALEYHNQALPLMRSVEDRDGEAVTLNSIGLVHNELGKLKEALDYFNQSLALRPTARDNLVAITLNNIGINYFSLGDLQKALEYFNQALPLHRAAGNRREEANTLSNIGSVYRRLGDSRKALEYYNQVLLLDRAIGDRVGEAITLHNIGSIHQSLNEPQKALEYYNQTLALAREMGNRRVEAITLQNIGELYRDSGDSQKALDFLNQALPLLRAVGALVGEATTLSNIGETYSLLGKPEEALSYLERALSLHRAVGDRNNEAGTLRRIARAERDRGRLAEARAQIETALNLMEGTRSTLVSQQDRTSFSASKQDYYELYIDVLMRMDRNQPSAGHDAAALQASERARARSLLETLTEARTDIRQGVEQVLLERERFSQQQLNIKSERLTRLLNGKHTEEQEKAARMEVEALLTDYQDVEAQIRAKSPSYAALTQPDPLSLKEIQQLLDKDTLLLEYALGEERSYLWAVTPTSIKSFELPKRTEIEATARRFYELVTTRKNRELDSQAEAAAALSRMLLGPVADQLGRKRLVIISDGALLYIPFAALPEPKVTEARLVVSRKVNKYQPLVVEHEIVSLPSASVLAVLRRELAGRLQSAKTVAVLADPVFQTDDSRIKPGMANSQQPRGRGLTRSGSSGDLKSEVESSAWESGGENFQRLQHSREEAEAIMAQVPARQGLLALDFAANRATVVSEQLAQYRIVHFATHGLLNNVHPELSGIVLSLVDEAGHPQNGFVRLNEVYNLKLPAELVVLSGCRTALGKEVRGEGLVGLTRGFMYAGAPRIVVSLWPVSDKGTAELMKRFYQGMLGKGMRPAAALRAAQIAMWKTNWWDAPYYWAGFVLQGEWR